MDPETLLIVEVLASAGGLSFLMLYAAARMLSHRRPAAPETDELTAKLLDEQPIPMPAHLTTRDEMVAWMVKDLPTLTAQTTRSKPIPRYPCKSQA